MKTHTCSRCEQTKGIDQFYVYSGKPLPRCKPCLKEVRSKPAERKRRQEYNAAYSRTKRGRERIKLAGVNYRDRYPERHNARRLMNHLVKEGLLKKPSVCSRCNKSGDIQGHHYNGYDNPYDVEWLCRTCHRREHASVPTPR